LTLPEGQRTKREEGVGLFGKSLELVLVDELVPLLVSEVVPLGPVDFHGCCRGTSNNRSMISDVLSSLIW